MNKRESFDFLLFFSQHQHQPNLISNPISSTHPLASPLFFDLVSLATSSANHVCSSCHHSFKPCCASQTPLHGPVCPDPSQHLQDISQPQSSSPCSCCGRSCSPSHPSPYSRRSQDCRCCSSPSSPEGRCCCRDCCGSPYSQGQGCCCCHCQAPAFPQHGRHLQVPRQAC